MHSPKTTIILFWCIRLYAACIIMCKSWLGLCILILSIHCIIQIYFNNLLFFPLLWYLCLSNKWRIFTRSILRLHSDSPSGAGYYWNRSVENISGFWWCSLFQAVFFWLWDYRRQNLCLTFSLFLETSCALFDIFDDLFTGKDIFILWLYTSVIRLDLLYKTAPYFLYQIWFFLMCHMELWTLGFCLSYND